jgi:hypothetical protein
MVLNSISFLALVTSASAHSINFFILHFTFCD